MEGLFRLYETGEILKSTIYWGVLENNYFTFFPDKKAKDPSFVINLYGCEVIGRQDESYHLNMIDILSPNKTQYLLSTYDPKDFNNWLSLLQNKLSTLNSLYKTERSNSNHRESRGFVEYSQASETSLPTAKPRKSVHRNSNTNYVQNESRPSVSHRKSEVYSFSELNSNDNGRRRSNYSNTAPGYKRGESTGNTRNGRKQSRQSQHSQNYHDRPIDTVKEDPEMRDEDVLETKSIDHIRKKYPITESIKRWSIAATDLVGKSNEELYIMLMQMNRNKANMDVWIEHINQSIERINEELEEDLRSDVREEKLIERTDLIDELGDVESLLQAGSPLIDFLESVVQMSDIYAGDNQTFHMVYHDIPPTGEENLDNLDFIRHNQERQIAKMLDEMKNGLISDRHKRLNKQTMDMNGYNHHQKTGTLRSEHSTIADNVVLNHTDSFINQNRRFQLVIDDIETDLLRLDPMKLKLDEISKSVEKDIELYREPRMSVSIMSINSDLVKKTTSVSDLKLRRNVNGNIGNHNNTNSNETTYGADALQPRRSTRKKPMSDMTASLNRSEYYKKSNVPLSSLNVPLLNQGDFLSTSLRKRDKNTIQSNQSKDFESIGNNFPKSNSQYSKRHRSSDHSPMNLVSNRESEISRTDGLVLNALPHTPMMNGSIKYGRDSRIDTRSSIQTDKIPSQTGGSLFKIDTSRYNSIHRSKASSMNQSESLEIKPEPQHIQQNFPDNISMTESDVSFFDHTQDINQRLNLNECIDGGRSWKSPSAKQVDSQLCTPAKLDIGDRYQASEVDENDGDPSRSMRMRKLVANENRSNNPKAHAGPDFEQQLLQRSLLAQEASRRSRQL